MFLGNRLRFSLLDDFDFKTFLLVRLVRIVQRQYNMEELLSCLPVRGIDENGGEVEALFPVAELILGRAEFTETATLALLRRVIYQACDSDSERDAVDILKLVAKKALPFTEASEDLGAVFLEYAEVVQSGAHSQTKELIEMMVPLITSLAQGKAVHQTLDAAVKSFKGILDDSRENIVPVLHSIMSIPKAAWTAKIQRRAVSFAMQGLLTVNGPEIPQVIVTLLNLMDGANQKRIAKCVRAFMSEQTSATQADVFKIVAKTFSGRTFALECIVDCAIRTKNVCALDIVALLIERRTGSDELFKEKFRAVFNACRKRVFSQCVATAAELLTTTLPQLRLCSASALVFMVEQLLVLNGSRDTKSVIKLVSGCFASYPAMRHELLDSLLAFCNAIVPEPISQHVAEALSGVRADSEGMKIIGQRLKPFLMSRNFAGELHTRVCSDLSTLLCNTHDHRALVVCIQKELFAAPGAVLRSTHVAYWLCMELLKTDSDECAVDIGRAVDWAILTLLDVQGAAIALHENEFGLPHMAVNILRSILETFPLGQKSVSDAANALAGFLRDVAQVVMQSKVSPIVERSCASIVRQVSCSLSTICRKYPEWVYGSLCGEEEPLSKARVDKRRRLLEALFSLSLYEDVVRLSALSTKDRTIEFSWKCAYCAAALTGIIRVYSNTALKDVGEFENAAVLRAMNSAFGCAKQRSAIEVSWNSTVKVFKVGQKRRREEPLPTLARREELQCVMEQLHFFPPRALLLYLCETKERKRENICMTLHLISKWMCESVNMPIAECAARASFLSAPATLRCLFSLLIEQKQSKGDFNTEITDVVALILHRGFAAASRVDCDQTFAASSSSQTDAYIASTLAAARYAEILDTGADTTLGGLLLSSRATDRSVLAAQLYTPMLNGYLPMTECGALIVLEMASTMWRREVETFPRAESKVCSLNASAVLRMLSSLNPNLAHEDRSAVAEALIEMLNSASPSDELRGVIADMLRPARSFARLRFVCLYSCTVALSLREHAAFIETFAHAILGFVRKINSKIRKGADDGEIRYRRHKVIQYLSIATMPAFTEIALFLGVCGVGRCVEAMGESVRAAKLCCFFIEAACKLVQLVIDCISESGIHPGRILARCDEEDAESLCAFTLLMSKVLVSTIVDMGTSLDPPGGDAAREWIEAYETLRKQCTGAVKDIGVAYDEVLSIYFAERSYPRSFGKTAFLKDRDAFEDTPLYINC